MRNVEEEAAVLITGIQDEVPDVIMMTGKRDTTAKDIIADRRIGDIADRLIVVSVVSEKNMRNTILVGIRTEVDGRSKAVEIGVSLMAIALMNPYVSLGLISLAVNPVMTEDSTCQNQIHLSEAHLKEQKDKVDMLVLNLIHQLKPVHREMQVFVQSHLLLCLQWDLC